MPSADEAITFKDAINIAILLLTVLAIVVGPLCAVHLTKRVDQEKDRRARQFRIFHDLMRTRRIALSIDHVCALNLVQLEFYGCDKIIEAYKAYISRLSLPVPREPDLQPAFYEEWDDRFFDLLSEIGKHLSYNLDKRDLQKFSYVPKGWGNDEGQLRVFRGLMIEVLTGARPLPVAPFRASDANAKFPPPPAG